MTSNMKCGVVLLAAGKSERMGKPKLLLPWEKTSILGHQLHLWQRLHAHQIAVVCASGDSALRAELDRPGFPASHRILNPKPELGMFSSIRCAAQWRDWDSALTHWVITLGDQPHLKVETLQTLLGFGAAHPDKVCQPRRLRRLRHPVVLPRRFFHPLAGAQVSTLNDFLKSIPEDVEGCDIDDAGLEFDIDTPRDYERALLHLLHSAESGDDARAAASI